MHRIPVFPWGQPCREQTAECFWAANASYSMTICAERNAVLQAIAAGQRSFRSIAIVGGKTAEEAQKTPCIPCGACLQVLAEFCDGDFPILLTDGVHLLRDFLPQAFTL